MFLYTLCGASVTIIVGLSVWALSDGRLVGQVWLLMTAAGLVAALGYSAVKRVAQDRQAPSELVEHSLPFEVSSVRALADGLYVAVMICDTERSIQYCNNRLSSLFQFDEPENKRVLTVSFSRELDDFVARCFAEDGFIHSELLVTYPKERILYARAWPDPIDSNLAFVTLDDITELRRLERVRQDFVANVSHEIRTPLTIMRSMAETLQDPEDQNPETLERYLSRIVAEIDRLTLVTEDLLVLSAAESNPIRKQECDIAEVFRNVTSQLVSQAKKKNVELIYEGPDSLVVEANAAQMRQVAVNLIDNAIKYTMAGSVVVSARLFDSEFEVKVKDTGIGIASDQFDRIFERFYRVDKGRSRTSGGTGLGLSIVKHIVESHGGQVTVESGPNEGSEFKITMPTGNLDSTLNKAV